MKKETQVLLGLSAVVVLAIILGCIVLMLTYRSARAIPLAERERVRGKCSSCTYVGTRLSYRQLYEPPQYIRLPHWQVTYTCTNLMHGGTRYIEMSEAWRKRTNN